jgi:hypothetical protein
MVTPLHYECCMNDLACTLAVKTKHYNMQSLTSSLLPQFRRITASTWEHQLPKHWPSLCFCSSLQRMLSHCNDRVPSEARGEACV